jgi:hypothetical protein
VLFAVTRDPASPLAVEYRVAANGLVGGPSPSAAGFEGYVDALVAAGAGARPSDPGAGLFGMARVAILPPSIEAGHESEAGWSPGVALVRVG